MRVRRNLCDEFIDFNFTFGSELFLMKLIKSCLKLMQTNSALEIQMMYIFKTTHNK